MIQKINYDAHCRIKTKQFKGDDVEYVYGLTSERQEGNTKL